MHGERDSELEAALAAQEEPLVSEDAVAVAHLVPGAVPAPDWSRLLLDAHAEGFGAVGRALEPASARAPPRSPPWAPGGGRNPRFDRPLLSRRCSPGIELGEHEGLPAYDGADGLFEGRAVVRLRSRSGRPTRLKTSAPRASATTAATTSVDRVPGARQRARRRRPPASPRSAASGS